MPHYFERPPMPDESAGRQGIPLPVDARWYVCQQTLFKIHPEFDFLLGEILRRDPSGIVVLFDGQVPTWKALLRARLERAIPDVVDQVVFLPRLARDDYLRLLPQADAVLDTIHYGGSTTAMHALGVGVPLVTLPGDFNPGRMAYTFFQKLGITDSVSTSPADYVERAIRIANDASLRKSLRSRILERCDVLFSNGAAAVELEAFFVDAAQRERVGRA